MLILQCHQDSSVSCPAFPQNHAADGPPIYRPYAPVQVFHGSADEEVSPARCRRFVEASRAIGGNIKIRIYDGASHGFDDPGQRRQRIRANAEAAEDAMRRAKRFMAEVLRDGQ